MREDLTDYQRAPSPISGPISSPTISASVTRVPGGSRDARPDARQRQVSISSRSPLPPPVPGERRVNRSGVREGANTSYNYSRVLHFDRNLLNYAGIAVFPTVPPYFCDCPPTSATGTNLPSTTTSEPCLQGPHSFQNSPAVDRPAPQPAAAASVPPLTHRRNHAAGRRGKRRVSLCPAEAAIYPSPSRPPLPRRSDVPTGEDSPAAFSSHFPPRTSERTCHPKPSR